MKKSLQKISGYALLGDELALSPVDIFIRTGSLRQSKITHGCRKSGSARPSSMPTPTWETRLQWTAVQQGTLRRLSLRRTA